MHKRLIQLLLITGAMIAPAKAAEQADQFRAIAQP